MSLGIDPETKFSPGCSKPLQSSLIIYTWLVQSDTDEVRAEVLSQAVHRVPRPAGPAPSLGALCGQANAEL